MRIAATGEPRRVGICHCMDCRKHYGAVFFAKAIFAEDAVRVTGETRHWKHRHFCPTCGGSVFARWDDGREIHLDTLDGPSRFTPTYESWTVRREDWLPALRGCEVLWGAGIVSVRGISALAPAPQPSVWRRPPSF